MADSTKGSKSRKPKTPPKPYADFPLFAHQSGRWCKKYWTKGRDGKWNAKYRFYGRWAHTVAGKLKQVEDLDASAAEAKKEFDRCWAYHSQGQEAPAAVVEPRDAGYTLRDLANDFLNLKRNRMEERSETGSRMLSVHTFSEYHRTCAALIEHFGGNRLVESLKPDDFEDLRAKFAKGCNIVTLRSKINRARVVFNYAFEQDKIGSQIRFGQAFKRPAAKQIRDARNAAGPRLFSRDELLMILDALDGKPVAVEGKDEALDWPASSAMRAMVLLGVNCGFGNTDCASLPISAIDFKIGWLEFPRPKTAVRRRVHLWPETVAAIQDAIAKRPEPADTADAGLCFLTTNGTRFVRTQQSKTSENRHVTINALSRRFEQLLDALNIGQKKGVNFYTLRHVFETIAGGSLDQVAVDAIMGHSDESMGGQYREIIEDERLKRVTDHVRDWLFGNEKNSQQPGSRKPSTAPHEKPVLRVVG